MELEYSFGTGAADPVAWLSPVDIDLGEPGGPDAVVVDFDGDGHRDDAMWDSDGDGVADIAALDLDDDGTVERYFADSDGSGVWGHEVTAPGSAHPHPERVGPARAGTERTDAVSHENVFVPVDFDSDGASDDAVLDVDHDGCSDGVLIGATEHAGYAALLVSPTVAVVDRDGDGRLDGVGRPDEPGLLG
ncbi:pullulanase [Aldersonia sp. NBC_00410]|uniref:pullulanase n=1 Tax=Aldersonia sp. NBC_00410 TaxID=2975954 RepID=UPI00225920CD|nr:pullulanase [Aldersonia sp. NBC_00410]MCX5044992.1 pullulanase [Aldersonia sp. NBC_00410]